MDIQRLRNLTTGRLHTKMQDIYEDIEYFVREPGIMTHMLPHALKILRPFLEKKLNQSRFWDGKYDTSHVGDIDIKSLSPVEIEEFWEAFSKS